MKRDAAKKHIVALGGGGFSEEPKNTLLDQYILALSPKSVPKVCFIPTASGDSPNIEPFLLDMDVIYVGGGNTRNMLTLWKN